jgi:hypothetical protein
MIKKPENMFECTVRFVQCESELERDRRYELYVDSHLRGIRLARQEKEKLDSDTALKDSSPESHS